MKKLRSIICLLALILINSSCKDVLEPKPIDLLVDDIVLNEAADVPKVEIGLYNAFRPIIPATVIAGDCTADMLIANGTFAQYQELSAKQITSANASATALWESIYNTVYIANFILERLPKLASVKTIDRNRVLGTARFLRGYAYFTALQTFGGVPKVTETTIAANRNIARASATEILNFVLEDYTQAADKLPKKTSSAAFASENALKAAWARFHLYQKNWPEAERFSTEVINSGLYTLDTLFSRVVTKDFPAESILEVGYTVFDDPGSDGNIGLNNLFVGRREIIPSNETVLALFSAESGERFSSISFKSSNQKGADNGWSVAKYGTADQDNNNVLALGLAEMYLIRAEARTQRGNVTGPNSAQTDINILRARADAWNTSTRKKTSTPRVGAVTQAQMLRIIERERLYELAFEGHRWYDLVRTGRAKEVMLSFSSNWKDTYELWPIPQRELLNNPALVGNQNPGY
jgi:starch-binding outer membrane protein, SusD/RagB family